ncbi:MULTISPECIES: AAA family ATPase [unclassified Bradyrhizobium]|uniref:AAA family ATPase n=1 Tax=unclassified Bradyrhizobium TaxID=2631580 RepID=UPI00070E759B|nr:MULTISPECIES: AAA family ATPase [unclassified Bradyrhizobium]KQT13756.1 hypothetical protein ASG57_33955 [Bradyrhizobium sp. Leaf396]
MEPRLNAMPPSRWSEILAELAGPGRVLQPEQNAAAVQIMSRPLACLVGGAGTGKTFTCKLICDLWTRFGGDVLLCALAGKAALRLSRSTGRLAKTLSRTLAKLAERDDLEATLVDENASEDEKQKAKLKLGGLSRIADSTLVVVDEASRSISRRSNAWSNGSAPAAGCSWSATRPNCRRPALAWFFTSSSAIPRSPPA